jgi:predicted GIY-YIG superfamily endonuclease
LNGRIYIGQTKGIKERLAAHNNGRVKSTRSHSPWELVAIQNVESRAEAKWIEKRLKDSHGARLRWLKHYTMK